MNTYAYYIHKSKPVHNSTKRFHVLLYPKCEKVHLNKVMKNQCQHMTEAQRNE